MNETIKTQLNHRTIREFKDEKIDKKIISHLLNVVNMSASSNGMQNMSVIRITDQKIKDALAENGNQEYMRRAPELWIFIVDLKRNYEIAKEMGQENNNIISFDKFIQGFTDAIIAAQNLTVAVESLGLGANYFGNIHNDTKKVIELLKMPKLTYPAVGVGFGIPNQNPQIKPRLDINLKTFENSYKSYDSYLEMIKDYDEEMTSYYDLRDSGRKSESFSSQIPKKQGSIIKNRNKMFETLIEQGFILNLDNNLENSPK
ncbi:nitroreductase family protein [uncultured Anaerococcus sp.]|uniref:nitroreductase family protein n=1 Tax=uncultured Anaerococcus sp. TaxID=293428 RepID=UPI002636AACE|nr:nitroreductase family protein [uncultured Anaerococcus sp.]